MSPPAAFITTTILLLIISSMSQASRDDEDEVKVEPGQDVTLQCRPPTAAAITLLAWTRPDLKADGYVFFFRNNRSYESYQHPLFRGRVELRDAAAMKDGDVSVIVRNVSVADTGTYECRVVSSETRSDRGYTEFKHFTNLTVTASGLTDGDTEDAGGKDAGDKDAGDKDAGDKDAGGKDAGGKDAGDKDAGGKDAGDKDAGGKREYDAVIVAMSVSALVVVVVVAVGCFLICRKSSNVSSKRSVYTSPPD